jgi:hypothetical protein
MAATEAGFRFSGSGVCRQIGLNARPVAQMARELEVSWHTVMNAAREHGEPLVDDPTRVGAVRMLGVDETSWLKANTDHPPGTPPVSSTSNAGSSSMLSRKTPVVIWVPGWTGNHPGGWRASG